MRSRSWLIGVSCVGAIAVFAGCDSSKHTPAAPEAIPPAASKTVSYTADVKPILEKHCNRCHLGGGKKGGFNMDTRENALLAGRNGARIVEGDSMSSDLILRVAHDPSTEKMPPKGEALTADEVGILRAWIDQGATWE